MGGILGIDDRSVRQAGPYYKCRDHQHEYILRAVIPLELKFGEVAVKVLHADLVVGSYHAALQQAPVTVNRAGVNVAAQPFLLVTIDLMVVVILDASGHRAVKLTVIGVDPIGIDRNVVSDLVDNALHRDRGHVIGAGAASTLHQSEHGPFIPTRTLAASVVFLRSHVRLVNFERAASLPPFQSSPSPCGCDGKGTTRSCKPCQDRAEAASR